MEDGGRWRKLPLRPTVEVSAYFHKIFRGNFHGSKLKSEIMWETFPFFVFPSMEVSTYQVRPVRELTLLPWIFTLMEVRAWKLPLLMLMKVGAKWKLYHLSPPTEAFTTTSGGSCLNPFWTAVPFWGQITYNLSELSPKRDCSSKGVKTFTKVHRLPLLPQASIYQVLHYFD